MKDILKGVSFSILMLLAGCWAVNAQDGSKPKIVSQGIVNGKAVSLPQPEYPAAARQARAEGEVKIQVLIDETGKVISAKASGGAENISLRQAAESAALRATFQPTLLSGNPVKVSGVIVYKFVLSAGNEEKLRIMALSTFLGTLRGLVNDLRTFRSVFEGDQMLIESRSEYPEFATDLDALSSLDKLSPAKRVELVDKVRATMAGKLQGADKWQFLVGNEFGDIIGALSALAAASNENAPDLSRFDSRPMRNSFARLEQLIQIAPKDFPRDVLAKFNELTGASSKEPFSLAELEAIVMKMGSLLETISPDK